MRVSFMTAETFTPLYGRYVNVHNLADNTTLSIKAQRCQPTPPTEATNCSSYQPAVPSAIVLINYDKIDTIEAQRYRKHYIYQPKNDYTNHCYHHQPTPRTVIVIVINWLPHPLFIVAINNWTVDAIQSQRYRQRRTQARAPTTSVTTSRTKSSIDRGRY